MNPFGPFGVLGVRNRGISPYRRRGAVRSVGAMTTTIDPTVTPVHPAGGAQQPAPAQPRAAETNGFSIASLVLGLVSIVAGFTFLVPIGGLVLGIVGLQREPASRTMAIWGVVLNTVMLVGTVLVGFGMLAFGALTLPFLPFFATAF